MHVRAERDRDREGVEVDTERDAAELGVVAAADARRELREQRPVVAEQDLGRRRAELDADGTRSGGGRLDHGADLSGLERRGPELHERDTECGRRSPLAIGDGQRHEPAVNRERVHGHDATADELLDEAVLALRLLERAGGRSSERLAVVGKADAALAGAVERLDHDGIAELLGSARHLCERTADDRARLRDACLLEPFALLLARDGDLGGLRRDRVREAEALGDAGSDRDRMVRAGSDHAVHLLRPREALDRRLVLDRDDRAAVGVAKPGGRRVAVGRDDGQVGGAGGCEHAELRRSGSEYEQAGHSGHCRGGGRPR